MFPLVERTRENIINRFIPMAPTLPPWSPCGKKITQNVIYCINAVGLFITQRSVTCCDRFTLVSS